MIRPTPNVQDDIAASRTILAMKETCEFLEAARNRLDDMRIAYAEAAGYHSEPPIYQELFDDLEEAREAKPDSDILKLETAWEWEFTPAIIMDKDGNKWYFDWLQTEKTGSLHYVQR